MWGLDFNQVLPATMILFAVVDIIGSIPMIIDLRQKVGHIQSEKASIVSAIIMIAFVFVGESILNVIGIDVYSFAVAGAFVLLALALEMVLGVEIFKDDVPESAAVFPLAFPLIAGAGSLTTILALKSEFATVNIIVAILLNILVVYGVLKFSAKIEKIIGANGIKVIRKVFGVILLAIAVKLFASNFPALLDH
jgi:multiple antibiotic resistance protein